MRRKRLPGQMSDREQMVAAMVRQYCPGGRLLDFPCGRGRLAGHLRQLGHDVVAADIDRGPFEPEDIPWHRADLDGDFGFEDASFDVVCCVAGLEHTESPYNTAREFRRILKAGGHLIVQVPNFSSLLRRTRFMIAGRLTRRGLQLIRDDEAKCGSGHLACMTGEQFRQVLATALFEIIHCRYFRLNHCTAFWGFPLWAPLATIGRLLAAVRRDPRLAEALGPTLLLHGELVLVARKPPSF